MADAQMVNTAVRDSANVRTMSSPRLVGTASAILAAVLFAAVAALVPAGAPAAGAVSSASPPLEMFTGSVDEFYVPPDPLPQAEPGTLIRVQAVTSDPATATVRIMYHSVDAAGRDRAVTGKLTYPTAPGPVAGRTVLSVANGTVGLAPQCAPSRSDRALGDSATGAVVVASDYIGSGPPGEVQAYLSRESEGHSVLDAARAARNFSEADAGTGLLVIGGSQGGHGALAASELAASWAPEFDLLGTVAMAPAAMFDRTYGPLDEVVTTVVTAMGLVGIASEHPGVDPADYLSAGALPTLDTMRTQCVDAVIDAVLAVPQPYFSHDPRTTEPARSIMAANDVGHVAASAPVLLLQGTEDWTVTPLRTDDLFARMCDAGQVTEYVTVPGADHGNLGAMAHEQIEDWFAARLAGRPAVDDCDRAPVTTTTPGTSTSTPPTTSSAVPGTTVPGTTVAPVAVPSTTRDVPAATVPTAGSTAGTGNGELARTGAPIGPLSIVALALIAAGVALGSLRRTRLARR